MQTNIRIATSAVIAIACLAGCATTGAGRLFPLNDAAMALSGGQPLPAIYERRGSNAGEITVPLPSGEVLVGAYTVIEQGSSSFASSFGDLYSFGSFGGQMGSETIEMEVESVVESRENSQPWTGTAIGNHGTRARCEGYVGVDFGTGVCELSSGELFELHL